MITLFGCVEGTLRHLWWWAGAFLRPGDPRAPLRLRRAVILVGALPLLLSVQLLHALFLLLDEVVFPGYRRVDVGHALFIVGIPRSGTTALHRAIAADTSRYTAVSTWEALLAPSIIQRRLIAGCARLDASFGGRLRQFLDAATRRLTAGLEGIHEVDLTAPEEDYLTLLPAGGCFLMLLALPGARGIQDLAHMDTAVSVRRRRRLLAFYERMLQRHLYADGQHRVLLSKNAAFGSWLSALGEQFPRARFLVCIRAPVEAFASQVSAIRSAEPMFATRVAEVAFQQMFVDVFAGALGHMAQTLEHWPPERAALVDMADLRHAPMETVTAALEQVHEYPSTHLSESLRWMREHNDPGHRPAPPAIPRNVLEARLLPAYERLRSLTQLEAKRGAARVKGGKLERRVMS